MSKAKNLQVILTQGISASGKSTWAKEHVQNNKDWVNICKDDLRSMLHAGKHSNTLEKQILQARNALIATALGNQQNIIISDTNLHPKHYEDIKSLCEVYANVNEIKIDVSIKSFMDVSVKECIERDLKRPISLGSTVIKRQFRQYHQWNAIPKTIHRQNDNKQLPKCITCDLDGTLSLFKDVYDPKTNTYTDLRSPYDASTCYDDVVNEQLAELLHSYKDKGYNIIFVSGREDKYEIPTREFLLKNMGWDDSDYTLHMRETGDKREDGIIKSLIFQDFILPQYQVHIHFDDRNRVVEAIRDLGVTVWQVADGDF